MGLNTIKSKQPHFFKYKRCEPNTKNYFLGLDYFKTFEIDLKYTSSRRKKEFK